MICTLRKGRLR